jgi:Protein of unknown function (DUF1566)
MFTKYHRLSPEILLHSVRPIKIWDIKIITLLFLSFFVFSSSASLAMGPYIADINVVIDKGTGLEWQKKDAGAVHTWQDALAYCEQLSLAEKTDWRLPNIRELKSLVDYTKYYPAIDPTFSSHSVSYWSATTVANDTHISAWVIFFGNGDDIWKEKTESFHVRCVRTETPGQ